MTQSKILFYKKSKGGPNAVILHRSEWNRLEKQASAPEEPSQQENEYLKALIEKSQGWMKNWPDTVQGCVALKEKQKGKQRAEQIAEVKAFSMRKVKKNNEEVMRKAKQKIFDTSCYGTKLISALLESKTFEERDAQIEFSKEIKEKEAELKRKKPKTVTFCTFDLDKNETAIEDQQKCKMTQNAKENKEMCEKKKEEEIRAKEQEKLAELTDAQLMKYLIEREQETADNIRLLEKQAIEQYAAANKKTKEEKAKRDAEYYDKIEICRKQQEKLNCKIRKVHQRIYKDSQNSAVSKTFGTVKKFQDEEQKRFEDFIEKGRKKEEERAIKRELRAKEKIIQDRNKKISIAEINKLMAENVNERECNNKCFCDRQCVITKSEKPHLKKGQAEIEPEFQDKPLPYFGPCNKLLATLKRREKEPPPWTDGKETNVLFMRNAEQTLRECKYKIPARKVVDEYRKQNGLDETTLPLANYN